MADSTINFTRVSGVFSVTSGSNPPKYFYGATGNFQQTPDGTGYLITIGNAQFSVPLTTLRVNGQTPANINNAAVLLNALFGT